MSEWVSEWVNEWMSETEREREREKGSEGEKEKGSSKMKQKWGQGILRFPSFLLHHWLPINIFQISLNCSIPSWFGSLTYLEYSHTNRTILFIIHDYQFAYSPLIYSLIFIFYFRLLSLAAAPSSFNVHTTATPRLALVFY